MKLLVIILCLPCFVFSQNVSKQSIDSILEIKGDKKMSSFKTLLRQTNQLPSDASIATFKYIDSIIKDNNTLRLHTYMYYTSTLLRYGKTEEALRINTKGLNLAKKSKSPSFLFEYYQMRANIFDDKAIMDSTIVYINKAEDVINKNKEELGQKMSVIYQQRAFVEEKLGHPEKEDDYMEKIAKMTETYPESESNAFNLAMVVFHFKARKNYAKHAYYAQKLEEYYIKNNGIHTPKSHQSISSMLKMDNSEEQIAELKTILNSSDSLNYAFLLPQTANMLGSQLMDVGNYKDAITYFNKSLDYNTNGVNPYSKIISYNHLYGAYYASKNYKRAIDALNEKINLQDSLRQEKMIEKIEDYKIKYETEKKTAEVKLLKAENKSKEQEKKWYLIFAFSGLIIASFLGYFAYRNRKQKLKLAKQKVELEAAIVQKNVLFKEVNHRVKNSLQMVSSLLFLQSENVGDLEAKNAIKDAQNRVHSLGLIHQKLYNKKHIVGVETNDYITELVQDIFMSHQLESQNLSYDLDIENMVLSVDTLTPIGLILNELIVNVLKHAFKEDLPDNKLTIKFQKKEDCLILKVLDNGVGYKGNTRENSFGLKLINTLSKKLDATFSIEAKSPKGTQAILHITDFELLQPL